jgi:hypothetical protein
VKLGEKERGGTCGTCQKYHRCGSQKCENSKFFLSFLIHIFSSYYHPISLRKHTRRLKNWTLWTNSPLVTTEASMEHTWINNYATMDNISQGFHPSLHVTNSNYNPQATDTLSTVQPHIYIQLFLFHFYILHHTCSLN